MRTVDTQEYLTHVCRMLHDGAPGITVPVSGNSMQPFLRPGDGVCLALPPEKLKKGDIILFTRPDGRFILHRITALLPDGGCMTCGDNQRQWEPVPKEQIRAAVTSVSRGKRRIRPGGPVWLFFDIFRYRNRFR